MEFVFTPARIPDLDAAEIAAWARAALRQFDSHLHAHGGELNALRSAGISQARIDALYPFSAADYRSGFLSLLSKLEVIREQARAWQRVDIHQKIVLDLPEDFYTAFKSCDFTNPVTLKPKDLPLFGKDPWCTHTYLSILLRGLYEYPALLRLLSRQLPQGTLSVVDPATFNHLRGVAEVLSRRLAVLA